MKIVFVTTSFLIGGLERSSANISNYLCNLNDVELTVITQYKFKHFYSLDPRIKCIEPEFKKEGISKLYYYLKMVFFFRKHFKKEKPHVILSFGEYCNFQTLLAGMFLNIPIVISDRASPELKISFPTNILRKLTYPLAAGFIAQTERMKISLIEKFGIKAPIQVIPNAIRKIDFFPELLRQNRIVAAGRLHPIKQYDKLIKAFENANTDNWELLILGDGGERNYLLELINKSSKKSKIILEEKTVNLDLKFAESKVFALTSESEGYPNSLCEAMAAGLVVVSFDIIAGPKELIEDGINGFLIEANNMKMLSLKISNIIKHFDEITQIGENAKLVADKLNIESIGNQYFNFLKENCIIKKSNVR